MSGIAGLPSMSASCASPGATRSTGPLNVANMRDACSADFVICGITARTGPSIVVEQVG